MGKDASFFSHDSNATSDPKIMILIDQFGLEGYGIFWILVELLRNQPEYKYPLKLLPIIAKRFYTSCEKMTTVVKNYGLFEIDCDDNFFSLSLNRRMEYMVNLKEKRRIAGIKSGEIRREKNEHMFNTCSTHVQHMMNKNEQTKQNKTKQNYIETEFDFTEQIKTIYDSYPTQCPIRGAATGKSSKDKKIIEKLISEKGFETVMGTVNLYVNECKSKGVWLKNFKTFLNNFPDMQPTSQNVANQPTKKQKTAYELARENGIIS